jgi:hypothetical protein
MIEAQRSGILLLIILATFVPVVMISIVYRKRNDGVAASLLCGHHSRTDYDAHSAHARIGRPCDPKSLGGVAFLENVIAITRTCDAVRCKTSALPLDSPNHSLQNRASNLTIGR